MPTESIKDLNNPIKERYTDDKQSHDKLFNIMLLGRTAVT